MPLNPHILYPLGSLEMVMQKYGNTKAKLSTTDKVFGDPVSSQIFGELMKKSIFTLCLLIATFGNTVFAGTAIDDEKCKSLASDVSIVAFSGDTNGMLYDPYDLRKGDGATYISQTRKAIKEEMVEFCKSEKAVTLEKFREKFHGTCSSSCQDQSKIIKNKNAQMNADTVCLSVCNKTDRSLEMYIAGANLAKSAAKKENADCSSSVSSAGRGMIKTKDLDEVAEKAQSASIQK